MVKWKHLFSQGNSFGYHTFALALQRGRISFTSLSLSIAEREKKICSF
jgi:hypothetical protein